MKIVLMVLLAMPVMGHYPQMDVYKRKLEGWAFARQTALKINNHDKRNNALRVLINNVMQDVYKWPIEECRRQSKLLKTYEVDCH